MTFTLWCFIKGSQNKAKAERNRKIKKNKKGSLEMETRKRKYHGNEKRLLVVKAATTELLVIMLMA